MRTERCLSASGPRALASRSVRVCESGSSDAGVFNVSRLAVRSRMAAPGQDLQTIDRLRPMTPRPKALDPAREQWHPRYYDCPSAHTQRSQTRRATRAYAVEINLFVP